MESIPDEVTALIEATAWRDRAQIGPNAPNIAENILKVDVLVFEKDGKLKIGKPDSPYVVVVTKELYFQDGDSDCRIILPSTNGANGAHGLAGRHADGQRKNGEDGGDGADGQDGRTPPVLFFYAENVDFAHAPTGEKPILTVVSIGGKGGNGGNGGRGGNGQDGHDYDPGHGGYSDQLVP